MGYRVDRVVRCSFCRSIFINVVANKSKNRKKNVYFDHLLPQIRPLLCGKYSNRRRKSEPENGVVFVWRTFQKSVPSFDYENWHLFSTPCVFDISARPAALIDWCRSNPARGRPHTPRRCGTIYADRVCRAPERVVGWRRSPSFIRALHCFMRAAAVGREATTFVNCPAAATPSYISCITERCSAASRSVGHRARLWSLLVRLSLVVDPDLRRCRRLRRRRRRSEMRGLQCALARSTHRCRRRPLSGKHLVAVVPHAVRDRRNDHATLYGEREHASK